jgi:hypothetical protein
MPNFVITTGRLPAGKLPPHRATLPCLLRRFGVDEERMVNNYSGYFGKYAKRDLWDIWEAVRVRWRKIALKFHPDRGCKTKQFTILSEIHAVIIKRLRQRGGL